MTQIITTAAWQDEARTPEERAAALLRVMTRQEKIQQLVSVWPDAEGASGEVAPMQDSQDQAKPFDAAIVGGIGQLTRPFGTNPIEPAAGTRRLAALQRQVMNANRFGIPAVAHEECLTGFTAWKATVYPTPLAWASTFNPTIIEEMGAAIGSDLRSVGVHQGLAPVLDVVRDYRWGRVEETMGEDPHLVAETGAAYVRGVQSAGVVATLKHFAGYAASRGARNHAPVSIGIRELCDVILPPFEKAVRDAGVRSVMNSYTETDGVPAAADRWLLTDVLRTEWGFTGTVVSDYWAVPFLRSMHRVAADDQEAGRLALAAGIDVELPHGLGFGDDLVVDDDEHLLDRAVLRVLTQKAELGLLDISWAPTENDTVDLDSARNRGIARTIAEQSVVLLSNTNQTVPVGAPNRIAVIGPGANDAHCLFGCYSFPNHVIPNHPDVDTGIAAPTVLEAIRSEFPTSTIHHERGANHLDDNTDGIAAAADAAAAADLTILVVGDRSGMFGHGTSGEGCDVVDLRLPGGQEALCDAVFAAAQQVLLVVLSGRPYAIARQVQRAAAAVQTFFPGEEGAGAIAGIISGRVLPEGRLPVQIPGDNAPQPGTYLAPPLALKSDGVSNVDPSPTFPFGHGLATTTFAFTDTVVSDDLVSTDGTVTVTTTVTNTGTRGGVAVPQLYLSDPIATVTRPVRRLIGYTKLRLAPGEHATVSFDVHADLAAFTGLDGTRIVEPGTLEFTIGSSAADTTSPTVDVELIGSTRPVGTDRITTVPVRVA